LNKLPTFGLGIIGLGYIGKIHAQACRSIPLCFATPQALGEIRAVLRSHQDGDEALIVSLGSPIVTTNMDMFLDQSIDVVDVCSPNSLHEEQVLKAAEAGKHIYCEKPLGRNLAEVQRMARAAEKAGIQTHSAFVLRYLPAIVQMKNLIEAGAIGEPFHFRGVMYHGSYLDANRPMSWRLRLADSGGGVWLDLGAHMVDLCRYLLGEVDTVQASMRTFISHRPIKAGGTETADVEVDDWCVCQLEMMNGASGSLEVSRVAAGTGEDTKLEVYGSKGALRFEVSKPETTSFFDQNKKQWVQGQMCNSLTVHGRSLEKIWPGGKFSQGMMVNTHMASLYDFFLNIAEGKPSMLSFSEGLINQAVLETAIESHRSNGKKLSVAQYLNASVAGS